MGFDRAFSTLALPPERRVAGWARAVSDRFVESGFRVHDPEGFDASMLNRDVADLAMTRILSAGHHRKRVTRSQRQAARAGEAFFLVSLQLEGHCRVTQDARETLLAPGQFAIYDTRRPYELLLEHDYQQAVLRVPRASLCERLPGCDDLTARAVPAEALPARLLVQMLRETCNGAGDLQPLAAADVAEGILAVLTGGLRGLQTGDMSVAQALPAGAERQLLRIKAHALQHLDDPALSLGAIAQALGLSKSYLHKLFRREGSTLERWIWSQRLAACKQALQDPRRAGHSITAIAYAHGFSDAAHFSRSFRQRYGMTPRECRAATEA
jgi:AraC-like DNA-binding protein